MRKIALLLLLTAGCTFHSTDSTEVGVLTRKVAPFGQKGVQPEAYPPGGTYFFMPFSTLGVRVIEPFNAAPENA